MSDRLISYYRYTYSSKFEFTSEHSISISNISHILTFWTEVFVDHLCLLYMYKYTVSSDRLVYFR